MDDNKKKEALIEANILQKLDHPNIIKFKDTFTMRKPKLSLCIVMEYCEGGDLKTKITTQNGSYFIENQILDWFTQICLSIKHIHDRKILHRDLKTQNIFLTKNGLLKLGDFGIAKCLNHTFDKASTYIGTPFYLSPEIIQNIPYSFKSDIWSLGIILYEMCCLKMPFDTTNIASLSLLILKGDYKPIPNHYSKELTELVDELLSNDQEKRPDINRILEYPIIKSRIRAFLDEYDYNREFSHTILHNVVLIILKKHPLKVINSSNELKQSSIKDDNSCFSDKIDQRSFINSSSYDNKSNDTKIETSNNTSQCHRNKPIIKLEKNIVISDKLDFISPKNSEAVKRIPHTNYKKNEKLKFNAKYDLDNNQTLAFLMKKMNLKHKNQELNEYKKLSQKYRKSLTDHGSKKNSSHDINSVRNDEKNVNDYLNTHKMLIELDNLDRGEIETNRKDDIDNYRSTEYKVSEKINFNEFINDITETNQTQDTSQKVNETEKSELELLAIESIKHSLESQLGKEAFIRSYQIIEESVNK